MRVSERLLTVLVLCLLAAAIPSHAKGSGEQRLQQAQQLLKQAEVPLGEAGRVLGRDAVPDADYQKAKKLIDDEALPLVEQAASLVEGVREEDPGLPDLPPTMVRLARAYLDAQQYSTAMNLLVVLLAEYPDYRADVDPLVKRIMEVRRRFNTLYAELVGILEESPTPENQQRGLEIVSRLKVLDPNPDPAVERSILIAELSLVYGKLREAFKAMMAEGAARIAAGSWADALGIYRGGLDVGKSAFDEKAYPAIEQGRVLEVRRGLDQAALDAAALVPDVLALPRALEALFSGRLTAATREEFTAKLGALAAADGIERRLRSIAAGIPSLQSSLVLAQGEGGKPDFWLDLLGQISLGRPGEPPEGMAYAARAPWVTTAAALSDAALARADEAWERLAAGFREEADVATFAGLAGELQNGVALALAVVAAETPAYQQADLVLGAGEAARAARLASLPGTLRQRLADTDAWQAFTAVREDAAATLVGLEGALDGTRPANADPAGLRAGRSTIATVRAAAVAGVAEWTDRVASAPNGSVTATQAAKVRDRFITLSSSATQRDAELAFALAALEKSDWPGRLLDAAARHEQGKALAEGTAQGAIGRRPDLAVEQFTRALADLAALLSDVDAWSARWTAEPAYVSGSATMASQLATTGAFRSDAAVLQATIAADATDSRGVVEAAGKLRETAEGRLLAGRGQEGQKKFTEALAAYQDSLAGFEESLAKLESAPVRARIAEVKGLIEKVTTLANAEELDALTAKIAAAVRMFTDSQDYAGAARELEDAGRAWEKLTGEPNETVVIYLPRAIRARDNAGKQEITRTDPLYEDIRGFMTPAELSYAKAVTLKRSAPTSAEYTSVLASARSSVQAITALVPEYREARLLALKIDRLELGEAPFWTEVRRRIEVALASARDPQATDIVLRDAYFSLKDYSELDGYALNIAAAKRREITNAVTELEYALGLKDRPWPEEKIRSSRTWYTRASNEYRTNTGDRFRWEGALWFLQQSEKEWPVNPDIPRLRNEILVKRGTGVDVLAYNWPTTADSELKDARAAQQDFIARSYATAALTVNRLLTAKPRNPLLLWLKAQIEAAQ